VRKTGDLRTAASDALYGCTTSDTPEQRIEWWQSGDKILMRHAVRMAEREETELIERMLVIPHMSFFWMRLESLNLGLRSLNFNV